MNIVLRSTRFTMATTKSITIARKRSEIKRLEDRIFGLEFQEMEFIEGMAYTYDKAEKPITPEANEDFCIALQNLRGFISSCEKLLAEAKAELKVLTATRI